MKHLERLVSEDTAFNNGDYATYWDYDYLQDYFDGMEKGWNDQSETDRTKNNFELVDLKLRASKIAKELADLTAEMLRISESHPKEENPSPTTAESPLDERETYF